MSSPMKRSFLEKNLTPDNALKSIKRALDMEKSEPNNNALKRF